ncbi:MAG: hypothetical protein AB7O62_19150 [Pirellulales bacterium]
MPADNTNEIRVMLFESARFTTQLPAEGSFRDDNAFGKDAAQYLMGKMEAHGATLLFETPESGDGAWHWYASINGSEYGFSVHWCPVGTQPANFWALQTNRVKGLFASLIRRSTSDSALSALLGMLQSILLADPTIQNIRVLTMDEFKKIS